MTEVALVGSTGLVGSNILKTLLASPAISRVQAFTRRDLTPESPKFSAINNSDTSAWAKLFPTSPAPAIFFSALGTTRAQAGGTDKQYAIDHDLNLELAKAAKEAGVKVYVLISTSGANATSSMFYSKMKGQLEEAVKELGFEHTVILRPGLIVGDRNDSRPAETFVRVIARAAGKATNSLKDFWAQDADVIGKAAVHAGLQGVEGKREKGFWLVGQSDIVRFGRTEWKE